MKYFCFSFLLFLLSSFAFEIMPPRAQAGLGLLIPVSLLSSECWNYSYVWLTCLNFYASKLLHKKRGPEGELPYETGRVRIVASEKLADVTVKLNRKLAPSLL